MIHERAGYFGRWAANRRLVARVRVALQAGKRVTIGTYTKATTYDRRHVSMFRADQRGAWVQHGKRWDDFGGAAVIISE
jgi:hypothetical protein